MKLFLIKPREDLGKDRATNPWEPWYDKAHGFVVRAPSDEAARRAAQANASDERRAFPDVWLKPEYATCIELTADGPAEVVLIDYQRG